MTGSSSLPSERPTGLAAALMVAVLMSCVSICYAFGLSLFAQIVPDMRADLGFDYGFVGNVTAGMQLASVAFAIGGAWLTLRIGAAKVVIGSVGLCAICLLGVPMAKNTWVLGALLVLMGGSGASAFVPMIGLVPRVVSPERRGFVMSLLSSSPSYGVVLSSLLVPAFAGSGRWQGVWWVVGTAAAVLVLFAVLMFRRTGLFRPAVDEAPDAAAAAGAASLRATMPWAALILLLGFFNGFATYPYMNFLSAMLREELGYSVDFAAGLWSVIGIVGIFAGFLAGGIAARFGVRAAILFCYADAFAASALMAVAPGPQLAVLSAVLFALSFYPIYGLVPAYVSLKTSPATAVTVFGMVTVLQGVGGTLGNYVSGLSQEMTGTFAWIYVGCSVSGAVCVVATLLLPRQTAATPAASVCTPA